MAEFTSDESKKLIEAFKTLAIKPKFDSPQELSDWLVSHASAASDKEVKQEQVTPPVTTMAHQPPRISLFSGEPQKQSDTPYDLWRYEVKCLMTEKVYTSATVANAVRRSLKGEACRTVMILGINADVQEIIAKLDSIYGPIDIKESLLASFYSARQGDDEDVSSWGCRLEDLLSKAAEQGNVHQSQMNDMLRNMFWTGLKKSLKDVSGHKFDATTDFDTLRVSIRRIEQDQKQRLAETTPKRPQSAKMATVSQSRDTELSEIKGMIRQLSAEMATMKQQQNVKDETQSAHVYDGSRQHDRGRGRYDNHSSQRNQGMNYGNNAPQYAHAAPSFSQASSYARGPSYSPQSTGDGGNEPTCWRCGQLGHLQSGCRVILDHVRRPLNAKGPMGRGRP
jgi:hypothetical protein